MSKCQSTILNSGKYCDDNCDYLNNLRSVGGYFHCTKKQISQQNPETIFQRLEKLKNDSPTKFNRLIVAFHLLLASRAMVFIDIIFILQKKCWDLILRLDGKLVNKFADSLQCDSNEINRAIKYLKKLRNSYSHNTKTEYTGYLTNLGKEKPKLCLDEIIFFKAQIKEADFDKFKNNSVWAWDYLMALYFLNEFGVLNIEELSSMEDQNLMNLKSYIAGLKANTKINVVLVHPITDKHSKDDKPTP